MGSNPRRLNGPQRGLRLRCSLRPALHFHRRGPRAETSAPKSQLKIPSEQSRLQSTAGLVTFSVFSSLLTNPPNAPPIVYRSKGQHPRSTPQLGASARAHQGLHTSRSLPQDARTTGTQKPGRAGRQGEVVGREWAGSLEEEPGGFSLRGHVSASWQDESPEPA